jgi:hypothetical protein
MRTRISLIITVACLLLAVTLPGSVEETRGVGVRSIVRNPAGNQVLQYQRSYALIIGISSYWSWPDLPGVSDDVEAVKQALEVHGFEVTVIIDPTTAELQASVDRFIGSKGMGENDRLLIYYAGHGHLGEKSYGGSMGYLVPADAPLPQDRSGFEAKSIPMDLIEVWSKRINSKHTLFVIDSCYSGAVFDLTRSIPASITYKTSLPVRQLIAAGEAREIVSDRSMFRRQFIAAINGEGDTNHDGYITGTELGEYLLDTVISYTKEAQHPRYGKIRNPDLDKGDFVFIVPGSQTEMAVTDEVDGSGREVWLTIADSRDPEMFRAFLEEYPTGPFSQMARSRLQALNSESNEHPTGKISTPPDMSISLNKEAKKVIRSQVKKKIVYARIDLPCGVGKAPIIEIDIPVPMVQASPDGVYIKSSEVRQSNVVRIGTQLKIGDIDFHKGIIELELEGVGVFKGSDTEVVLTEVRTAADFWAAFNRVLSFAPVEPVSDPPSEDDP